MVCLDVFFDFFRKQVRGFLFFLPNVYSFPNNSAGTQAGVAKLGREIRQTGVAKFGWEICLVEKYGGKKSATVFWNRASHGHKVGLCFSQQTQIFSGIQLTMHFMDIFVVETKWFVGSTVNVILTRQTCSQLSTRPAESKNRALGNCFSEWICYRQNVEETETWVYAIFLNLLKENCCAMATSEKIVFRLQEKLEEFVFENVNLRQPQVETKTNTFK